MEIHEDGQYSAPQVRLLGSVEEMTNQPFDKVGSIADIFTALDQNLNGEIIPDP